MQVLRKRLERISQRVNPFHRLTRKHEAELAFWQEGLLHLEDWFEKGKTGRSGIRPPRPDQKINISESWVVNAVLTRHAMCPSYTERLGIDRDRFHGKNLLEIGCGPLAPILQFTNCTRHGVDPLVNVYMNAGWPLFEYDAKFINTGGECLPYPDGYFDAVISVNALDHVDDFEQVASEMQRVVKNNGGIYFEVEYHAGTVTEPVQLNETRVVEAFSRCELTPIINRSGGELYEAMVKRFDLLPYQFQHFEGRFCTWHGIRK